MFRTIADFEFVWSMEIEKTQKVLKHVTDRSLHQEYIPGYRTIGRLGWHIVQNLTETARSMDLQVEGPDDAAEVPPSAREIFAAFNTAAISLLTCMKKEWKNETLDVVDEVFGRKWKRSFTLATLVLHQVHHRGQLTTLMRLAGLEVPGIFGPARHEWAVYGKPVPRI